MQSKSRNKFEMKLEWRIAYTLSLPFRIFFSLAVGNLGDTWGKQNQWIKQLNPRVRLS